jgi:hypothetical protein
VIDERDLEQAERVFAPPEGSFDGFLRRRDRKRRNNRIAAGIVGIAVFVAAVWIVTSGGAFNRTHAVVRVMRALIVHDESFLRDIGAYEKGDPYGETQHWRL